MTREDAFKAIVPSVAVATEARQNVWGFLTHREKQILDITCKRIPEVLMMMDNYRAGRVSQADIKLFIRALDRRNLA